MTNEENLYTFFIKHNSEKESELTHNRADLWDTTCALLMFVLCEISKAIQMLKFL